jgi:phage tail sheath gpL-like
MPTTAIRNPKVTLNLVPRDQTVPNQDYRPLIVGQKLAAGSATAGLVADVPRTDAEINALFGARSHLAMLCRAFRKFNKFSELDVIALADNGSAVKATSKVVWAGTATAAVTIFVDVVSSFNHSYEIDVEIGDVEEDVSAKLAALIAVDTDAPFTTVVSTTTGDDDTVTFTAANGGTLANGWLIRIRDEFGRPVTIPGMTATLTGWASGATDPVLTSVLDPTANIRYHGVVWPSKYSTSVVKSWINARFNLDNDIKDGVVFQWVEDSFANVKTAANAMNSPSFVMMTNEPNNTAYWKGPHLPEAPDVLAAIFVAIEARRFETGISISDLVVTNEPNDQFGGIHTASLPYFNTPFADVGTPDYGSGYTYAEQLELEQAGVSVIGVNEPRNGIITGVMVTTYANDAAGNPDDTWRFLEWRRTHAVMREFFVNNLREDLSQHRMTLGKAVAGYSIVDEPLFRALCSEYYELLAEQVITVSGRDGRRYFDDNLVVTFKPAERKIEMAADVPIVSQLGSITGSIRFNFLG